jgi:hypothetical protein
MNAIYKDIWAGDLAISMQPFKTKRKGISITLYRWVSDQGISVLGGVAGTQDRMIALARRHALITIA